MAPQGDGNHHKRIKHAAALAQETEAPHLVAVQVDASAGAGLRMLAPLLPELPLKTAAKLAMKKGASVAAAKPDQSQ